MPGYRTLSASFTGSAADSAREAESLRREGDPQTAVMLLEEALEASRRTTPELPGWLCGRLAALYRTVGRYDDEVALLEQYRESQSSEEARTRYDARLSKARTIAERKRRSDSGALSSVRKVLGTPRRRSGSNATLSASTPPAMDAFRAECARLLAVATDEPSGFAAQLDPVLAAHCMAAREGQLSVEHLVHALKSASQDSASTAHLSQAERDARYSLALVRLLAAYFEERER